MRVIIAGGGIGGLATALSLHAAGFSDILVAEATQEIGPLGVGINLLPHAVRELTELGLADRLPAIGVATAELAYFNRQGQAIWSEPRGRDAGYHWPQYSVHRGELQMMLLDAVRERLGPDAVRTGMRLTGFTDDVAVFGTQRLGYDLLIGADGIHSSTRALLYPNEGPPPWNGLVLWRGITRGRPYLTGRSMIMAGDGVEKFVAYPISEPDSDGNVLINWIAERPVEGPEDNAVDGRGDWNRRVDVSEFAPYFAKWRYDWLDVPEIIAGAEATYRYPMVDREPLPRWTHGRVTLVGDAAHAMYPIGSNGASQAILDARVLAHALGTHPDPAEALASYEGQRRPPTTAIQQANRQMGPEVVLKIASERAPHGFSDIEQVVPLTERQEIALRYKKTAGFDPRLLNDRPSYGVDVALGAP